MDYPLGSVGRDLDLTQVAHHTEYFHSDSADLTPDVSQQRQRGQSEEDRRSKLVGLWQVRVWQPHFIYLPHDVLTWLG